MGIRSHRNSNSTENEQSQSTTPNTITKTNENESSNQMVQDDLQQRQENLQNVDTNLGEVEGLTGAVSNTIGNIINALVPRDRDKAGISFSLKIPVHPAVKITIGLSGDAMRLGDRVMLMTSVKLGARMETTVSALWIELEAYLQVAGEGYLKTVADTPQEGFEFIALGIREIVAQHSEKVASMMMSKEEREQVISDMSDTEFVELGLGLSVEGGISIDTDTSDQALSGVSASGKLMAGTKFSNADNDGNLEQTSTGLVEATISAGFDLSKFGIPSLSGTPSLSITLAYLDQKLDSAKVAFGVSTKLTPNLDASFLANIFVDMVNTMARTIIDGQKMLGGEGSILIGRLGRTVSGFAMGDEALGGAIHHLSETTGVSYNHAFAVGLKWSATKGCELELSLSKTANVEKSIGDLASINASMGESIFFDKIQLSP
jgi:hypothetical protein